MAQCRAPQQAFLKGPMMRTTNDDRALAPSIFRAAARAAIFATGLAAVGPALADTVRCESVDGRERYCNANTRNGVDLVTQLSSRGCYQGETWGYDRRGIWVSAGCRAIFETGYNGYSNNNYNNNNYNNYHSNNGYYSGNHSNKNNDGATAAIAIGAILGAAVIASAASGNKNKSSGGSYSANYDRGCDYGRKDRQAGKNRGYYNHSSAYNSEGEQAFEAGYNKCWNSN
jgi:hypothetical protein